MSFTSKWALATLEQAVLVFLTALVGSLVLAGAGAFTLSTAAAAAASGGAAVLSFLQSTLAALVHPTPTPPVGTNPVPAAPTVNLITALRLRSAA